MSGDFNNKILRPTGMLVHLESAPFLWCGFGFDNHILPGQGALFFGSITSSQDRHEYSGLGKTVEAGMILRQLLLDAGKGASEALVLVPDSLIDQWREELGSKFRTQRLPAPVELIPHSRITEVPVINRSVTIVDEAHRLCDGVRGGEGRARRADYERLSGIARNSTALLLLSATPVRSNEDGFLGLLHLLDPGTYDFEDLAGFRRKVEMRDELAEIMSAIDPDESPRYLAAPLEQLRGLLAGDGTVAAHVKRALQTIGEGDRSALRRSVVALRVHVAEGYRIHRRMIRNRRSQAVKAGYPARGRERSPQWRLPDADPRRRSVFEAVDDFKTDLGAACTTDLQVAAGTRALQCVLGRALAPAEALRDVALGLRWRPGHDLSPAEVHALSPVAGSEMALRFATSIDSILASTSADSLIDTTDAWAARRIGSGRKLAVACSFPRTATLLAMALTDRFGRHRVSALLEGQSYDDRSTQVQKFARSSEKTLLVIDRSAEEGANLQFTHEVFHVNIPTSVSHLEQRLGRFDRWDELGFPVRSTVVVDQDPLAAEQFGAWLRLVDETFSVFTTSSATLQYVLADIERDFFRTALRESLADAFDIASAQATALDKQRKRIVGQDSLDSIEDRAGDEELGDRLARIDKDAAQFETAVRGYVSDMLQFSNWTAEAGTIRFGVSKKHPPLLPQQDIARIDRDLLDLTYTADRVRASASSTPLGLLRWGEPLIDSFTAYASTDDRGRAFAVEIVRPHPEPESDPLVLFCFDFVVSADTLSDLDADLARAVATRAASLLPAVTERVWWAPGRGECPPQIVADVELRGSDGGPSGVNLGSRPERFRELTCGFDWRSLCERSLAEASAVLRGRDETRRRVVAAVERARADAERERAILTARGELRESEEDGRRLSGAVEAAVRDPKIELDSCGAVIITWMPKK